MNDCLKDIHAFLTGTLAPLAERSLSDMYAGYCAGSDAGVEIKGDRTPAGIADRETERLLREEILRRYPEHGIFGEESGAYETGREFVWVLDPLDGTKEYLARKPGCFGSLTALLQNGVPVFGAIIDPISGKRWINRPGECRQSPDNVPSLKDATAACTNPESMFKGPSFAFIDAVRENAGQFRTELNCLGFAYLLEGTVDVTVERDLGLHDIAALIPVLQAGGMTVIDFNGRDYCGRAFDLPAAANEKYAMIAARSTALAEEVRRLL